MHEVKLIICHPKLLHDRERSHLLDRINTESGPRLPMLVYMPYVRARFSDYLIPRGSSKTFWQSLKILPERPRKLLRKAYYHFKTMSCAKQSGKVFMETLRKQFCLNVRSRPNWVQQLKGYCTQASAMQILLHSALRKLMRNPIQ